MEEMLRGIMQLHVCRKDDIFRQRRLNDSAVGGGGAFRGVYPARAYTTLVVLVIIPYCSVCAYDEAWNSKMKNSR